MPKRILDYDSIWPSEHLAKCKEENRVEYTWVYGVGDANANFELNYRLIYATVYHPLRPSITPKRMETILRDFMDHGLLFTWKQFGKIYGHWMGGEKTGRGARLPSPSQRWKFGVHAPQVPLEEFRRYARKHFWDVEQVLPYYHKNPQAVPVRRSKHDQAGNQNSEAPLLSKETNTREKELTLPLTPNTLPLTPNTLPLYPGVDKVLSESRVSLELDSVHHVTVVTNTAWSAALCYLKKKVNPHSFSTWFAHTSQDPSSNGRLLVRVPSKIFAKRLSTTYREDIKAALAATGSADAELHFLFEQQKTARRKPAGAA